MERKQTSKQTNKKYIGGEIVWIEAEQTSIV